MEARELLALKRDLLNQVELPVGHKWVRCDGAQSLGLYLGKSLGHCGTDAGFHCFELSLFNLSAKSSRYSPERNALGLKPVWVSNARAKALRDENPTACAMDLIGSFCSISNASARLIRRLRRSDIGPAP